MKRILPLLALVLALISCEHQPATVAPEAMQIIGFELAPLAPTRADVVDPRASTLITKDSIFSMGIFAYSTPHEIVPGSLKAGLATTTPNLIYNQKATRELVLIPDTEPKEYELNDWTYEPEAYWPVNLALNNTFFAYSPHSDEMPTAIVSQSNDTGTPTITYTLPDVSTEMIDLLYSDSVLNQNRNTNQGKVKYKMNHALSWLSFVVAPVEVNKNPDSKYKVNWIAFMADELPATATFDLGTRKWIAESMSTAHREFELNLTKEAESIAQGEVALVVHPDSRLVLLPFTIKKEAVATIDITFVFEGIEYYYFAPFPEQRMTAGNVSVYVINISPDGAIVEFQKETSIDNWLKAWEDYEGGDVELEIY
ncbi:fimbrillin family protein [Bacteroides sp. OttesenSCG-928-D19]|nr:fimbrillin family protein [Bacteroides sp. OttesenSCG-928-D19]